MVFATGGLYWDRKRADFPENEGRSLEACFGYEDNLDVGSAEIAAEDVAEAEEVAAMEENLSVDSGSSTLGPTPWDGMV